MATSAKTVPSAEAPVAAPALGLRERGKLRRRKRIKEAARAVFVERGFEAATTREIAERAEVSLGTLFAYAPTKSELLLMIVNDDHAEAGWDHLPAHTAETPLMELMLAFGRREFNYWGQYPEIARQARREIAIVLQGREAGPEATRFAARKPLMLAEMSVFVKGKQKAGALSTRAPADLVADLWWAIYNQCLHSWLHWPEPDVRKGLVDMQCLLALALDGLGALPAEFAKVPSYRLAAAEPMPKAKPRTAAAKSVALAKARAA